MLGNIVLPEVALVLNALFAQHVIQTENQNFYIKNHDE
jgi:hypothetical protein